MDPIQQEPKKEEERVPIKSLRTYQGDVEEAMTKNKTSATTIFVAEQKRKIETPRVQEKPVNLEARNKLFTIIGIALVLIGGLIVFAVYYVRSNEKTVLVQETKAILPFSEEQQINIASSSRESLVSQILAKQQSFKLPVNSVLFLDTTIDSTNSAKVSTLLPLVAPNMPASLSRSFSDTYMLGIYSFDTNEPFLILKTDDYASSYAGMLKWEKDMPGDLQKMFTITQNASSTLNVFTDEAIRNKDLRILKDPDGKTTLMYSFIDKKTLVITKNESIFNAILAEYLTSQNTK